MTTTEPDTDWHARLEAVNRRLVQHGSQPLPVRSFPELIAHHEAVLDELDNVGWPERHDEPARTTVAVTSTGDPELDTMALCVEALALVGEPERRRTVAYLFARYALSTTEPTT